MRKNLKRDSDLSSLSSGYQSQLSSAVRKRKSDSTRNIHQLNVKGKVYQGDRVPDGFFDSISSLKKVDEHVLSMSDSYLSATENYKNILKICTSATKVPSITIDQAEKLLKTLRPSVNDFYSITSSHYLNSGRAGLEHFC